MFDRLISLDNRASISGDPDLSKALLGAKNVLTVKNGKQIQAVEENNLDWQQRQALSILAREVGLWETKDKNWSRLDKMVVDQLEKSKTIDWDWLELILVS